MYKNCECEAYVQNIHVYNSTFDCRTVDTIFVFSLIKKKIKISNFVSIDIYHGPFQIEVVHCNHIDIIVQFVFVFTSFTSKQHHLKK